MSTEYCEFCNSCLGGVMIESEANEFPVCVDCIESLYQMLESMSNQIRRLHRDCCSSTLKNCEDCYQCGFMLDLVRDAERMIRDYNNLKESRKK